MKSENSNTAVSAIKALIFCSIGAMSACSATDAALVSGNPSGALDLAGGSGTVQRAQDGTTTFRYAFQTNGLGSLVAKDSHENVRRDYIAQFVAKENICRDGWEIADRTEFGPNILYQGTCI